jgi:hypothetical protein
LVSVRVGRRVRRGMSCGGQVMRWGVPEREGHED